MTSRTLEKFFFPVFSDKEIRKAAWNHISKLSDNDNKSKAVRMFEANVLTMWADDNEHNPDYEIVVRETRIRATMLTVDCKLKVIK